MLRPILSISYPLRFVLRDHRLPVKPKFIFQERISEVGARRGTSLGDVVTAPSIDDANPILAWRGISPIPAGVSAKQENVAYPESSSFFWQECGGQGF